MNTFSSSCRKTMRRSSLRNGLTSSNSSSYASSSRCTRRCSTDMKKMSFERRSSIDSYASSVQSVDECEDSWGHFVDVWFVEWKQDTNTEDLTSAKQQKLYRVQACSHKVITTLEVAPEQHTLSMKTVQEMKDKTKRQPLIVDFPWIGVCNIAAWSIMLKAKHLL